jgi:type I restriction enzyme M protein
MFEQAFKNIDDVLRKEAGCTTELDYTEQTSWLLFLKYLDALEEDRATEAELQGRKYIFILDKPYRWESWAAPKDKDGKLDHHKALVGDDFTAFVNQKLFPYLTSFKQKATGPNTIEYKIGQIFGEIKNKIQSGYNLREIIDHIDELRFRSQTEKHELSHLYEAKIRNMGNAGRNGGEYYTPRPLIRAIIQVVQPKIGDRIYDGALGSAGFLCESFEHLKSKGKLTTKDLHTLQTRTFYGKEKKSLAFVIAIMAQSGNNDFPRSSLKVVSSQSPRYPGSNESSASSTKHLSASPPPKPTPKRTSKTPEPSSTATSNPSSPSLARAGRRQHSERRLIYSPGFPSRVLVTPTRSAA